jgi:hypothetical protein
LYDRLRAALHQDLGLPRRPNRLRDLVEVPERVWGFWFGRYSRRLEDRRDRAVTDAAAGAAISARLAECGGLSLEEWEQYDAIAVPVAPYRWPHRLDDWLHAHGPGRRFTVPEAYVQRARRGWADRDVYGCTPTWPG